MAKASSVKVQLQSGSTRTLIATWAWTKDNTDHYRVQWWYYTGNKDKNGKAIWLSGEDTTTTLKQSTYDSPSEAKQVRFRVKPVAKTHKVKKKKKKVDVAYWTADWTDYTKHDFSSDAPDVPPVPTVSIDKYTLTAEVDYYDSRADKIEFEVVKNDNKKVSSGSSSIKTNHASYSCSVSAGVEYKVRTRAVNGNQYSSWSEYSGNSGTIPSTPGAFTSIEALSATEIQLKWNSVSSAISYVIEYAKKKSYFDASPSNVQSITITGVTTAEITGLDSGETWWFRIQAVNNSGSSGFSEPVSKVLGKKPSPPTTWSLQSTVSVGETAILYWVHNSEDGSKEVAAQVELSVNGVVQTIDVTNNQQSDEEHTSFLEVNTSSVSSGGTILWRVRTKGVTNEFSDWSIQRSIKVFAPATITFNDSIPNLLLSYPLSVSVTANPNEQNALRFFVSIIANDAYEAIDYDGTSKWISENEEIFSKNYYGNGNNLNVSLVPSDVTLYNGMSYTLKVSASMDSGMHPEVTADFTVSWRDDSLEPEAEIGYDYDNISTYIIPYCVGNVDSNLLDSSGNGISDSSNNQITTLQFDMPITNVTLSVYRREFDGTFTLIAEGLSGSVRTAVTDPHPALDMARYRIVAISNSTGQIGFTDIPGFEINETAVIIQWAEEWMSFDPDLDGDERPNWVGSLLRLPYNIDVSDNYSPDASLVEYIGREHPVSYYGTQRGSTATWNMDIERDDEETLYALRRLSVYRGDVYVREPSGSGYWANVKVSFSSKHCDVIIPVTLNIVRVEGGA